MYYVNITKGEDGTFGFKHYEGKVGTINKGSRASYTKMQEGDTITKINNKSVTSMTSSQISRILGQCEYHVTLELCRIGTVYIYF